MTVEERIQRGRDMYELGLRLGALGTVTIGSGGGALARALARAAGCGAALAGAEVKFHDGGCAGCGAWLGRYYGFAASLFVRQRGGEAALWVLDSRGQPLEPPAAAGPVAPCTGEWDLLAGADCAWAANRAAGGRRAGVAAVDGPAALTLALERLGCTVLTHPRENVPLFRSDEEGFSLSVELGGTVLHPEGEDALAAAANFLRRSQSVPAFGFRQTLG